MANQQGNGRNVARPDEHRPSWRLQDEGELRGRRGMSDEDERSYGARDEDRSLYRERERMAAHWDDRTSRWDDRDERYRSAEHYGPGQIGYGGGRYEPERPYAARHAMYPGGAEYSARERGLEERYGRGTEMWSPHEREYLGGYGQERERERGYGDVGYGSRYGGYRPGREDITYGSGYLAQGGQQMGYGREAEQAAYGREAQPMGYERAAPPMGYGREPVQQGPQQRERGVPGYQGWGQQGIGALQGGWGQQTFGPGIGPSFRGRGPAGYVRSDERIKEIVCEVLTDHDQVDATNIEVTVKNGEVTLSGTVDDRRQKRLAEDAIENLSFVKDVTNQLRIASGERRSASAVNTSGKEQELQQSEKRHRA